jgi:hypothetical protein
MVLTAGTRSQINRKLPAEPPALGRAGNGRWFRK